MTAVIVAAPKFAGLREHDCMVCGAETLKHPVFLSIDGSGPLAAGTGCAARLLYGHPTVDNRTKVLHGARAAEHVARAAAALEARQAATAENAAFCAWILEAYGWTITQPSDLWDRIADRTPHSYRTEYRELSSRNPLPSNP